MPEVPPVIRIVLPVIFMGSSLLRCGGPVSARSLDHRGARPGAGEKIYPWIGGLCHSQISFSNVIGRSRTRFPVA